MKQFGLRTFLGVILTLTLGFVSYGLFKLGHDASRLEVVVAGLLLLIISLTVTFFFIGLRNRASWTAMMVLAVISTELYAVLSWFMLSQIAANPGIIALLRGLAWLDVIAPIAGLVFSALTCALMLTAVKRQQ